MSFIWNVVNNNGRAVYFAVQCECMEFTQSNQFLGKIVEVKIDRQLGTKHPKYDWKYPVNYGFVPSTLSPDGEELDAYVLGVDEPVTNFEGTCIAIIHRTDDNDDKLIVVPEGSQMSDEEIRSKVDFQEKYYKSEIIR